MTDQNLHFEEMVALLENWANINTFSLNREGIEKLCDKLLNQFSKLQPDEIRKIPFENGSGIFLKKREHAPFQIYLGGHIDTVFDPAQNFLKVTCIDDRTLQGPGVTDMKGGLVILFFALQEFEKYPESENIGWEIFLNPDEEIGSPYSTSFIKERAKKCDIALFFEPTLSDGSFVSERKGSSNYLASAKGKAAHAGRSPSDGINAIELMTHFLTELHVLSPSINIGTIRGGTSASLIPDKAESLLNLRAKTVHEMERLENKLSKIADKHHIKLQKISSRPPKKSDTKTKKFYQLLSKCSVELNRPIQWKSSGGVCDGNTFANEGIPTIDSLGAKGGLIHTEEEFIHLESLPEKAELVAKFLKELAADQKSN